MIASAARPSKQIDQIAEDREEGAIDAEAPSELRYCADEEARWIKKGKRSTLGYKGFARCDEDGFVDKVMVRAANEAESPHFAAMVDGAKARRILADKAYAAKANRDQLKGCYKDGIMRKAARGRPLRTSERRFNKMISRQRFRIEQCFGTAKRLFGMHRARYFGRARTQAQMAMTAISMNLLKAANKIILTPKQKALK